MSCSAEYQRRRYATDPVARAKAIASARRQADKRFTSSEHRSKRIQSRRRHRAKLVSKGLTQAGTPRKARSNPLTQGRTAAIHEARQAWRLWIDVLAPNRWMRAYYRSKGKPWNNPRISGAQRFKIRYWLDPAFRAHQIERVQTLKTARAKRIALTDDGSLTGARIIAMFAAAKQCAYCFAPMRSVEKSLDHVVPLFIGGTHSVTNTTVCCKRCNSSKGTKALSEWTPPRR